VGFVERGEMMKREDRINFESCRNRRKEILNSSAFLIVTSRGGPGGDAYSVAIQSGVKTPHSKTLARLICPFEIPTGLGVHALCAALHCGRLAVEFGGGWGGEKLESPAVDSYHFYEGGAL
jgi:hypothetical protein